MALSAAPAAPSMMVGFSRTLCASFPSPAPSCACFDTLALQSSLPSLSAYPSVVCGRGDKRTAKGKRFRHSYGNSRPRNSNKSKGLPMVPLPPRPPKKDPLDDGEFIDIIIDDNLFTKKALATDSGKRFSL